MNNKGECPFKEGDIVAVNDFFRSDKMIRQIAASDIEYWNVWWDGLFTPATLEEKKYWYESEKAIIYVQPETKAMYYFT